MMKKKVLVYGNQKCFSKYLICKFQDILILDVCKNFKDLKEELDVYSVIVLVIYTEEDLIDFFKIYRSGIPLIICSFNNRVLDFLTDLENLFLLDTSKIRSEILAELSCHFNETILNIEMPLPLDR